ncbi:hypothetical protein BDA99DRAFT_505923 [Phascolomyces articulosus]|uniref:F-box domain-containing protein n=1 Tax=Phascolomyces articulosus TaxID=60185 RepID=A0AAD5K2G2_9FUNG|nr:hypothetical protein BDA99DRAFT_505923 [Phascolomyces articulosus]
MRLELLPLEILDNIFCYLSFHDRWRVCTVSNGWRSTILCWKRMFEQLSTSDYKKNMVASLLPYRSYIHPDFVKSIQLNVQKGDELSSLIEFLADNKCSAITKVDITAPYWMKYNFFQLNTHCAMSLNNLSLKFNRGDDDHYKPPPDLILRHYPRLQVLCYIGPVYSKNGQQWKPSFPTGFKHQYLRDLVLHIHNSDGTFEAKNILVATPRIRRLRLGLQNIQHTSPLLLLDVLKQHCPELVTISFLHRYGNGTIIDPDLLSMERRTNSRSGLENLVFHDSFDEYPYARQLIQFLTTEYHQSLYTLDITCAYVTYDENNNSDSLDQLSSLVFPCLERFSLTDRITNMLSRRNHTLSPLSRFLSNSVPNLRHLALTYLEGGVELKMLVQKPNHLETLYLDHCNVVDLHQITSLLGNHGTNKEARLSRIALRCLPHISPEVLSFIASTQGTCLKELIIDQNEGVSIEDIELFLDNIPINNRSNMIHTANISLIYQDSPARDFPDKDKIDQMLAKLNLYAKEWRFTLSNYADLSLQLDSYSHVRYRKNIKKNRYSI